MRAEEARKVASETIVFENNAILKRIKELIQAKATGGFFSFDYYEPINQDIKIILEDLGYKIETRMTGPNEECYVISW